MSGWWKRKPEPEPEPKPYAAEPGDVSYTQGEVIDVPDLPESPPVGTVLADRDGDIWRRDSAFPFGWTCIDHPEANGRRWASVVGYGPFVVLRRPSGGVQ